jgi:Rap1a immunity proteins
MAFWNQDHRDQDVRWMSAILVSAAVLAAPVSSAQESASRATAMLPQCTAWLRIHSGRPDAIMDEVRSAGSPAVALSQFEKAGFCAGVVLGISEMLTAPFACIPNSVPAEQIVQAVVNFADRQPETMKDNFGLLVGAALSVAWPCPKDK